MARTRSSRRSLKGGRRRRRTNNRRTRRRTRRVKRGRTRGRKGGIALTGAASAAVLPFGLLWAQRAYKGKHGKSLRKIYRH